MSKETQTEEPRTDNEPDHALERYLYDTAPPAGALEEPEEEDRPTISAFISDDQLVFYEMVTETTYRPETKLTSDLVVEVEA